MFDFVRAQKLLKDSVQETRVAIDIHCYSKLVEVVLIINEIFYKFKMYFISSHF